MAVGRLASWGWMRRPSEGIGSLGFGWVGGGRVRNLPLCSTGFLTSLPLEATQYMRGKDVMHSGWEEMDAQTTRFHICLHIGITPFHPQGLLYDNIAQLFYFIILKCSKLLCNPLLTKPPRLWLPVQISFHVFFLLYSINLSSLFPFVFSIFLS